MAERPLIGIVLPILSKYYIRDIVRGALAQAQSCGCDCILLAPLTHLTRASQAQSRGAQRIYELIGAPAFDGFLYVKDDSTMGTEAIAAVEARLLQSNRYVMTVDDREHPIFDSTQYDDHDDFAKVVRHLIEVHGYRRIYCLTGLRGTFQAQTRLQAYQSMMEEHGLPYDETYYEYGTFWVDSAIAYAQRILSGELARPEAVVCGNDVMAMAFLKTLQAGGIRVPEDIAVAGYDGFPFSANVDVSLTTYARDHFQLGADAMRRLCRNTTGILSRKIHRPESGLIIGSSCGCDRIPAGQMLRRQMGDVPRMWEEDVFCDDMAFDLLQAHDVTSLLTRTMAHRDVLYRAEHIAVYLDAPDGTLRRAVRCDGDKVTPGSETLERTDVRAFLPQSDAPGAVFVSPLHVGAEELGLLAVSYGDSGRPYDRYHVRFASDLTLALHRLQERSGGEAATESVRQTDRREREEKLTALHDRLREAPGEPWTVERMCQVTDMSRSTLQKHFRAYFGQSVSEALIAARVEMAKRLLTETALPLSEIAARCGYSTESYFMKQFKSVTGMTPTAYRHREEGK